MPIGAIVLVVGAFIVLCSMGFALYNMSKLATGKVGFDNGVNTHLGAIAGVASGAFVSLIGVILLLLPYLK